MAYNPSNTYNVGFFDFSKEPSSSRVNSAVLTAGNIAAQITAAGNYLTALQAIVLGTVRHTALSAVDTAFSATYPTDPSAQRERKWLVQIQDQVNLGRSSFTVPTADLGGTHLLTNSDFADLSDADIAAYVTALEAFVRSPDGNAVAVLDMLAVGRNL